MTPLDHALALADEGIPVFPVRADKIPACKHGHLDATIDHNRIRDMFDKTNAPLVGIPTGEASGFDVFDVDPKHDGDKWSGLADLPPTRTHRTRSGGRHYLFRHADGVRNSQSKIAPGIDVRGSGGYIVSWPAENDLPIAPWPADVLEAALRKPPLNPKAEGIRAAVQQPSTADALAALADAVKLIEDAQPGERYEVVKTATWSLSKLILGGFLDEDTARDAVRDAAEAAGGEDMTKVDRLWDGALEKVEPATVPGSEFDALPPESAEELIVIRGGRPLMIDRIRLPSQIANQPARPYVVKGLMRPGDVGAIIGPPGAGKSMLAPMMGYRVALGLPVFGMRSRQGRVLYMAAEDVDGMALRIKALEGDLGHTDSFGLVDISNLRDDAESSDLMATVRGWKPAVAIIDTVGAAWAGMSENDSAEMGIVVALSRRIAELGASVVLVHHTAKQSDGTPRGHSSLNGTLDWSLVLGDKTEDGIVRCKVAKNRAGTSDLDIAFTQRGVTMGHDEDGDPVTAPMAVELAARPLAERKPAKPLNAAQSIPYDLLVNLLASSGAKTASIDDWREVCLADGIFGKGGNSFRAKFSRAKLDLIGRNLIAVDGETVILLNGPKLGDLAG